MIRLFLNYYVDDVPARRAEIDDCLLRNLRNPHLGEVVAVTHHCPHRHDKLRLQAGDRPTYGAFFELMRQTLSPDDVGILANADIYFDDTLARTAALAAGECWALARWEDDNTTDLKPYDLPDGQDVWMFRGPPPAIDAPFTMGKPGCDNRIAYLLKEAGLRLRNPCLSVRCIHLHRSSVRRYARVPGQVVEGPYEMVYPEKL